MSKLLVVSGPGGVGKGTVVAALCRRRPDIVLSVSATTRPPREGEVDGVDYHFLDPATFDEWVAQDRFLEWAEFAGHRYGTPWSSVDDALASRRPVVLEIEVQGARQVRERLSDSSSPKGGSRPGVSDAVLVFLAPPSEEALLERMRARGADGPDRVAQRLEIARWELAQRRDFDHVVVNDRVERAVAEILRILDASPADA